MTILVTGAAGFIGYSTARRLLERGERVVGIDNLNNYYDVSLKEARLADLRRDFGNAFAFDRVDFADNAALTDFAARHQFDRIVHLGAQAGVRYSIENPSAYIQSNLVGHANMLEVAHMGLHVAQMTSQKGIMQCFDAVTTNAARVMHLQDYGLEPGCDASFVLLQARDTIEAIRLRANRLKVWKKGKLLAETAEVVASLTVANRPARTAFFRVI